MHSRSLSLSLRAFICRLAMHSIGRTHVHNHQQVSEQKNKGKGKISVPVMSHYKTEKLVWSLPTIRNAQAKHFRFSYCFMFDVCASARACALTHWTLSVHSLSMCVRLFGNKFFVSNKRLLYMPHISCTLSLLQVMLWPLLSSSHWHD